MGNDATSLCEHYEKMGPNSETLEAMEEIEQMIKDPSLGESYASAGKLMSEIFADVCD